MVEMSLDRPIPFDQLKPEQAEQRAQMQANLRELCAGPGQVLVAHYSGPKHPKSDVENLLLYNIGNGCFAGALKHGVQFEEKSSRSVRSEYRYQLAEPSARPTSWRRTAQLAQFEKVRIPAPNSRWAHQIWLSLRSARLSGGNVHRGPFEVEVRLQTPAGVTASLQPEKIKKLLDGLVSAYQWESRSRQLGEVCARLSALTGQPAERLSELLCEPSGAVLGTPGELLAVYRQGIKWNPDDHHCVAGTVTWAAGPDQEWSLSGRIWSLQAGSEIEKFVDEDQSYLGWIAQHPDGYVLNVPRSLTAANLAKFHKASCWTVTRATGGPWTAEYIKLCADSLADLQSWAQEHVRGTVSDCGTCHPRIQSVFKA
ncbi:MAG: hypothetical protein U0931_41345 [Vulcanimicrobiota bacterium]